MLREAVSASEEKAGVVEKRLVEAEEREEVLGQQLREARAALEEKTVQSQDVERQLAEASDMVSLLQNRSDEDRLAKESLDKELLEVKAERDAAVADLEDTRRKLRDAAELAEKHAREAETHRAAFIAGLDRVTSSRSLRNMNGSASNLSASVTGYESDAGALAATPADERVATLREQLNRAHEQVRTHQEAGDAATEKVRRAEERIAGLEAYQEQSAREGLQLRRQLQAATKEVRTLGIENRDLKIQLENQQRDANALAVQHHALKEVLNDRAHTPSRFGTPTSENGNASGNNAASSNRLRELEAQVQAATKAHDEMKVSYEQREKEIERAYNEKLEQLGKDYRSAVHYVKGTEKMLRRMKEELERYKSQNAKFQSELEATVNRQSTSSLGSNSAAAAAAAVEWENEKAQLQGALAETQKKMSVAVAELEAQVSKLHEDVAGARAERDKARRAEERLEQDMYELGEKYRSEIARMRSDNAALETRASDAERRVMMLLESTITAQQAGQNGANAGGGANLGPGAAGNGALDVSGLARSQ
ncbi:Negative regulator of mitotic exit, partial [Ascosphaera atra]